MYGISNTDFKCLDFRDIETNYDIVGSSQFLEVLDMEKALSFVQKCFETSNKGVYFQALFTERNLDYEINPTWAKKSLTNVVLQGGMDPKILLRSEEEIYKEAKKYLDIFKNVPYIFNLGHGLIPETDPDKLGKLIKFVREYK